MTTHNHASMPGNSPPWAFIASMSGPGGGDAQPIKECKEEAAKAESACKGLSTQAAQCKSRECSDAKKCMLVSYNQGKRKSSGTRVGCCPGEQPHHLVEAHCFFEVGDRGGALAANVERYDEIVPCQRSSLPFDCG